MVALTMPSAGVAMSPPPGKFEFPVATTLSISAPPGLAPPGLAPPPGLDLAGDALLREEVAFLAVENARLQRAFAARESERAMVEESARLARENEMLRMHLQSYSAMSHDQNNWWQQPPGQFWSVPKHPIVDAVSTNAGSSADSGSECETISLSDDEKETTKIMKNVPLQYTRQQLLDLLDTHGFRGKYNFVYLPVNFRTCDLHGYAFVNFTCDTVATQFEMQFAGFTAWGVESDMICEVKSSTHQGLKGNIMRYRNSPVMHDSVDDAWRPILLADGVRVPFPAPTRSIKAPRTQRRAGKAIEGDEE